MSGCGNCSGSCGGCSGCTGCGGAMELSEGEITMLQTLGQIPFLPVARKLGEDIPVYLILQCLEKRGLISIDYAAPLKGFDDAAYAAYPIRGSFGLTARGQRVIELLEWQGWE